MRQVDGFRNSTADEWLSCPHHTDMTVWMNEALAFFAAFVSAIKHRQMLVFEEWSTFNSHSTAYIIVCSFYFVIIKSEFMQQAEIRREILFCTKAKAVQTL